MSLWPWSSKQRVVLPQGVVEQMCSESSLALGPILRLWNQSSFTRSSEVPQIFTGSSLEADMPLNSTNDRRQASPRLWNEHLVCMRCTAKSIPRWTAEPLVVDDVFGGICMLSSTKKKRARRDIRSSSPTRVSAPAASILHSQPLRSLCLSLTESTCQRVQRQQSRHRC